MGKLFISLFLVTIASAELSHLPDEFTVVERFFALNATFDVAADGGSFAIARKRLLAPMPTFDLFDCTDNLLASAALRFFAWGAVFDVWDCKHHLIGRMEEVVFRIFPWAEYKVFDHNEQLVAIAKMNLLGTRFQITSPENESDLYAEINRPLISFLRDYWTVTIHNRQIFEEERIDPRLLILLAAYQTDLDQSYHRRKQFSEQLQQDQFLNEGRRFD